MLYRFRKKYVLYSYRGSEDRSLDVVTRRSRLALGVPLRTFLGGDLVWWFKRRVPTFEQSPKECWLHFLYSILNLLLL